MNKKVIIGFDIGIASVGWCITEFDTLKIIKHGVRTFETVDNPKNSKLLNETRREKRHSRRQINRRKTLKRDFIKFLIDSKFINDIKFDKKGNFINEFRNKYINDSNWRKEQDKDSSELGGIFDLRLKGLTKELNKKELISVLYWYINHRGFKYEVIKDTKDNKKTKRENVFSWSQKTKTMFPVEIQKEYFDEKGYLNGTLNSIFHSNHYKKEIEQIFLNITYLNNDFKTKFFDFFERQRSFEEGPGSKESPSEYGLWSKNENGEVYKKYNTIWEKTIGKCSIYKDLYRAPKMSLSSELFNLLNDLNNLKIKVNEKEQYLTEVQKIEIIKILFEKSKNKKTINGIVQVKKYIKQEFKLENPDSIRGFRINSKDKEIITKFETYHLFNKVIESFDNFNYTFEDIFKNNKYQNKNLINELSDIFSKTTLKEKRIKDIEKNFFIKSFKFSEEQINKLSLVPNFKSGTHQYSYKALDEMIEKMIIENKNSMQILYESGKDIDAEKYNLKPNNILSNDWIENVIITPTVKRSLNQTIKIFNALNELCKEKKFNIKNIVIEMARETNNQDIKDQIKNQQEYNELINNQIENYIKNLENPSNILKNKIWFWIQQKQKDVYTGFKIEINELINKHYDFEIDHIIPYNQCFDNSRENKVLTTKINNKEKKDRTPFQYLSSEIINKLSKEWEEWYLDNSKDRKSFKSIKKLEYLMSKIDFSNPNNQIGFIGRNLVDTRYITKEFLNVLNKFKEINKLNFGIKTINGKMTSFVRNTLNINKMKLKYIKRKKYELTENDKKLLNFNSDFNLKNPILDKLSQDEIKEIDKNKKNRIWHGHHAQDAYFITVLSKSYESHKIIEKEFDTFFIKKIDPLDISNKNINNFKKYTQEKEFNNSFFFKKLKENLLNSSNELNNNLKKMLFSRRVEKKLNTELFNETLYRGIITNECNENEIQKIVYKKLENLTKKDCEKYFDISSKDSDNVIIKKINKPMYKELCEVYKNYLKESKPFKKAMEINKENFILCNIKNKQIHVKKIQIKKNIKNENEIIILKNNKNSFYESFNWIKIHVYKDQKNKFVLIPINALNAKFILDKKHINGELEVKNKVIINEIKLNKQKEKLNIDTKQQPIDVWYKGDILKDLDTLKYYFIIGIHSSKIQVEIKPIEFHFSEWIQIKNQIQKNENKNNIKDQAKQLYKSINTWKFKKINLDLLGNEK